MNQGWLSAKALVHVSLYSNQCQTRVYGSVYSAALSVVSKSYFSRKNNEIFYPFEKKKH